MAITWYDLVDPIHLPYSVHRTMAVITMASQAGLITVTGVFVSLTGLNTSSYVPSANVE